jgi:mannose-6-phosphate isomerase
MLGDFSFESTFGLLIKFINAEDVLSVQVHPDSVTCKRMGKGDPKTECWYIISAEPGAVIYKGLKEGVTRDQFADAISSGDVDKLLNKVQVHAGQCHFLPAGTVHAIGAGLLIAEIQTPSDTTYRVFDWNRLDGQGQGRQLHISEALESINFDQNPDELVVTEIGRLVESEFFSVDKRHQAKNCEELLKKGGFEILIFLSGSGDIIDPNDQRVDFKAGDCFFIPAAYEGALCFSEDTEYLVVTI